MKNKAKADTELWIADTNQGLIEADDFVFGDRDEQGYRIITFFRNKEVIYSGRACSFSRKDVWEGWYRKYHERKAMSAVKRFLNEMRAFDIKMFRESEGHQAIFELHDLLEECETSYRLWKNHFPNDTSLDQFIAKARYVLSIPDRTGNIDDHTDSDERPPVQGHSPKLPGFDNASDS